MAVNPTGSSTDPTAASQNGASGSKMENATKGLGQEAFLQLLITQLQNQNPLQPQDPTQFVAELAQFSSLDLLGQINTSVKSLGTQLGGSTNTTQTNQANQTNQTTS
jgi:flagellar basal-body rod modification protein FlgD